VEEDDDGETEAFTVDAVEADDEETDEESEGEESKDEEELVLLSHNSDCTNKHGYDESEHKSKGRKKPHQMYRRYHFVAVSCEVGLALPPICACRDDSERKEKGENQQRIERKKGKRSEQT
jgi:hypothetical protein